MRKRTYIFRKKPRAEKSSWAVFLSFCGLLVLTPPAIAQAPGLQPAHAVKVITAAKHGS